MRSRFRPRDGDLHRLHPGETQGHRLPVGCEPEIRVRIQVHVLEEAVRLAAGPEALPAHDAAQPGQRLVRGPAVGLVAVAVAGQDVVLRSQVARPPLRRTGWGGSSPARPPNSHRAWAASLHLTGSLIASASLPRNCRYVA